MISYPNFLDLFNAKIKCQWPNLDFGPVSVNFTNETLLDFGADNNPKLKQTCWKTLKEYNQPVYELKTTFTSKTNI